LYSINISYFNLFIQLFLDNFSFSGPSSDCGAGGQSIVRSSIGNDHRDRGEEEEEEAYSVGDTVEFQFTDSPLSSNGTSVRVGQIPEIYFRLPSRTTEKGNAKIKFGSGSREVCGAGNGEEPTTSETQTAARLLLKESLLLEFCCCDGGRRSSPAAAGGGGRESTLFLEHLSAIAQWAISSSLRRDYSRGGLDGGDGPQREDVFGGGELLEDFATDTAWRRERVALVAATTLRLIRLHTALCAEMEEKGTSDVVVALGRVHDLLQQTLVGAEEGLFFCQEVGLSRKKFYTYLPMNYYFIGF
jgi:hypothetical protein